MDTVYAFDGYGRMTSIEHKDGAAVLDGWTYGMDGGAITSITADDGSRWAYEHDANSRLTKAERYDTHGTTLLHRYSYTYDDGDNLITKAVLDAVASVTTTTAFGYNDANELVSQAVGGTTTSFAYDAWGRMTSKSDGTYSATYAYRYGNKLASVASDFPSEGNATYQYDGAGKRRQRTVGGTTTNIAGIWVGQCSMRKTPWAISRGRMSLTCRWRRWRVCWRMLRGRIRRRVPTGTISQTIWAARGGCTTAASRRLAVTNTRRMVKCMRAAAVLRSRGSPPPSLAKLGIPPHKCTTSPIGGTALPPHVG